jgi:hypothetical protein
MAIFIFCYTSWRFSLFGLFYWYFLTDWNWGLNCFYFIFGSLEIYFDERFSNILRISHHFLFAVVQTISWLVFIIFWILLSSILFSPEKSAIDKMDLVIGHSMNLIPVVIDLYLSKTKVTFYPYVFAPLIVVFIYICFFTTLYVTLHWDWPYPFVALINGPQRELNFLALSLGCIGMMLLLVAFFQTFTIWLTKKRDLRRIII